MPSLFLEWNQDLLLTNSGSVLMAAGWDEVRQRIIRRFLTNSSLPLPDGTVTPPDYIFDSSYGLGAGALIDQNPDATWTGQFTRRMREAVVADAAVAPGALPSITITKPQIGTVQVFVTVQLISGMSGQFSMTIGTIQDVTKPFIPAPPYVPPPSSADFSSPDFSSGDFLT